MKSIRIWILNLPEKEWQAASREEGRLVLGRTAVEELSTHVCFPLASCIIFNQDVSMPVQSSYNQPMHAIQPHL